MSEERSPVDQTKREFVSHAAYVVPAVVTFAAAPSFASAGSGGRHSLGRTDATAAKQQAGPPGSEAGQAAGSPTSAQHRRGEQRDGTEQERAADGKTAKTEQHGAAVARQTDGGARSATTAAEASSDGRSRVDATSGKVRPLEAGRGGDASPGQR